MFKSGHHFAVGLTALNAAGCGSVIEAEVVDDQWLESSSEVSPTLDIPCAGEKASPGPLEIVTDDKSGYTIILEVGTQRVWLREPFGLLPDTCWWVPDGPAASTDYPSDECFGVSSQYGNCEGDEPMGNPWFFHTPGLVTTQATATTVLGVDGLALLPSSDGIERIDLTPTAFEPVDESENSRTFLRLLEPMRSVEWASTQLFALNRSHLVWWDYDEGILYWRGRQQAKHGLNDASSHRTLQGPGHLHAAGDYAAIATTAAVHVFSDLQNKAKRERRTHPTLNQLPQDIVIEPSNGDVSLLLEDGVLTLPSKGSPRWTQVDGATKLLLARPNDVPTVYAWGNTNGKGVIYRLDDQSTTRRQRFEYPILGVGIGEVFQEVVVATNENGNVRIQSYMDVEQKAANAEYPLAVAFAAFVESPRDDLVNNEEIALSKVESIDNACQGLEMEALVCCVQHHRGLHLEQQLSSLDSYLRNEAHEAAVVLGVNPSAMAQSVYCEANGYDDWASTLPKSLARWTETWQIDQVGSLALLLHTPPFSENAGYVQCPESWDPSPDCWEIEPSADALYDHYLSLSQLSRLEPWTGREPDWSLLGGGFEAYGSTALPSWVELFPDISLPNSQLPLALYFGQAGMNPAVDQLAAKELSPLDTTQRALPVYLGRTPTEWDQGAESDAAAYYPGITFAIPWLHEMRRSGLLFSDFTTLAHPSTDWRTSRFAGDESSDRIDYADAALIVHYLQNRVLAHREVEADRWTYLHLHDLSSLTNPSFDRWIVKADPDLEEDALSKLVSDIERLKPSIYWSPLPPAP